MRAYSGALEAAPDFTNAYLNLAALLCESGECDEAVRLSPRQSHSAQMNLSFTTTVRWHSRICIASPKLDSYDKALRLDPDLADARYNAGRIHDELGHGQMAIRHWSAYRRLSR